MSDSASSDVDRQRDMADKVEQLLASGRKEDADKVLQEALRDAMPKLPLRFPLRLVRCNLDGAKELAAAFRRDNKQPRLRLVRTNQDPRYIVAWEKRALGAVPAKFANLLDSFGDDAMLYEPRLHRIVGMGMESDLSIAVELVRPEMRMCASCSKTHSNPHLLCVECRQERRKPRLGAQIHETTTEALQQALEHFNEPQSE